MKHMRKGNFYKKVADTMAILLADKGWEQISEHEYKEAMRKGCTITAKQFVEGDRSSFEAIKPKGNG